MSIYEQLSVLVDQFTIKQTSVVVPAISSIQLCDIVNQRVYLAFTYLTTATPVTFKPGSKPSASGDGFPTQGNSIQQEFWVEKHKSLVGQNWFAFNSAGGPITIQIFEILYGVIEG